jgi:uridine kinase
MRRYDCQTGTLGDPVRYPKKRLNIVEGSYSLYPSLREHYKVKIFLTIPREEQLRRILRREGQEQLERFKDTWIPLEEAYFAGCGVMECADVTEENA